MYLRSSGILSLAALAIGLNVTATRASAQQATFYLPFAARWGSTVLESGDYKLSDTIGQSGSHLIYVSQRGRGVVILPKTRNILARHLDRSSLELVNVNGTCYVMQYRSALTDQVFTFPAPKATPEIEPASAAVTSVPVAALRDQPRLFRRFDASDNQGRLRSRLGIEVWLSGTATFISPVGCGRSHPSRR
jgi:hypothetical protein